jgi:iron(III) transport system ATP-binding protein
MTMQHVLGSEGAGGGTAVRQGAPGESKPESAGYLRIEGLNKWFGGERGVQVLSDVTLSLAEGELLTLLGPSGCGKTTTLRCVAGLERPDRGSIWVRGEPIVDAEAGRFVLPERRQIGMAFQSYALWPHMRVVDNVGYPLRMRRVPRPKIVARAGEALDRVGLAGKLHRFPRELSGGEQQRVALARAIVANPDILLLDEPLSNLDARLRQQTLVWLVGLLRELKITTIYVTHDQSEALAISDQIVIMRSGRILQRGTPAEIYDRPATSFVAEFVGAANLVRGRLLAEEGGAWVVAPFLGGRNYVGRLPLEGPPPRPGDEVALVVRPEMVQVEAGKGDGSGFMGTVELRVYSGSGWQYIVKVGNEEFRVTTGPETVIEIGDAVSLSFKGAQLPIVQDVGGAKAPTGGGGG